jgi:[ribosomal protein S5]-alanine N-acetyltransferase
MLTFDFTPFPTLTTARLLLREPQPSDADALFVLRSNPALMRYIPRPLARVPADAAAVLTMVRDGQLRAERINWAITRLGDPQLIGMIGYVNLYAADHRAEIGYILGADFHGQGLMDEALAATVAYGFEVMNLHSIEAIIRPENTASRKLVERNGFILEGLFKEDCFFDGQYLDSAIYSRLAHS